MHTNTDNLVNAQNPQIKHEGNWACLLSKERRNDRENNNAENSKTQYSFTEVPNKVQTY